MHRNRPHCSVASRCSLNQFLFGYLSFHCIGVRGSSVYGSIIDGIFRGVVEDPIRGSYYMEENSAFFKSSHGQSSFGYRGHSIMYHQDAVKFPER